MSLDGEEEEEKKKLLVWMEGEVVVEEEKNLLVWMDVVEELVS